MQRLEVSGAVRPLKSSLGVKGLIDIVVFDYISFPIFTHTTEMTHFVDKLLIPAGYSLTNNANCAVCVSIPAVLKFMT